MTSELREALERLSQPDKGLRYEAKSAFNRGHPLLRVYGANALAALKVIEAAGEILTTLNSHRPPDMDGVEGLPDTRRQHLAEVSAHLKATRGDRETVPAAQADTGRAVDVHETASSDTQAGLLSTGDRQGGNAALVEAAKELRDDLIMRAKARQPEAREVTVAAGNGAWFRFTQALDALSNEGEA